MFRPALRVVLWFCVLVDSGSAPDYNEILRENRFFPPLIFLKSSYPDTTFPEIALWHPYFFLGRRFFPWPSSKPPVSLIEDSFHIIPSFLSVAVCS